MRSAKDSGSSAPKEEAMEPGKDQLYDALMACHYDGAEPHIGNMLSFVKSAYSRILANEGQSDNAEAKPGPNLDQKSDAQADVQTPPENLRKEMSDAEENTQKKDKNNLDKEKQKYENK